MKDEGDRARYSVNDVASMASGFGPLNGAVWPWHGAELEGVEQMSDAVNQPAHYTQGEVECIEAIEAATIDKAGIEAVCVGNVIKYLWRYEAKGGRQDVQKARWYLERLLDHMGDDK